MLVNWKIQHKTGFSLVEMLVAVAILAILAALTFPVVEKIRESANNSACLANLRRIDTGLQSYLADNNFIYHSHYWQWPLPAASLPPGEGNSWFSAAPDGRLTGSYVVPFNQQLRQPGNPMDCRTGKKKAGSYHIDYAYNLSLAGVSKASLQNLKELVTVIEGGDDARITSGASNPSHPQFLPGGTAYFAANVLLPVHNGKCNALYADGHIDMVDPKEMKAKNFNPFLE